MTNQGVFVLGVGAQKAGTSWLYWYLSQAQNADCGKVKEYHVWDPLYLDELTAQPKPGMKPGTKKRIHLRQSMRADPGLYFDYFAEILGQEDISVTADITPAYAPLPREAFERIQKGFARRDIEVRVLFLMRDPLERCWSQARMNFYKKRHPAIDFETTTEASDVLMAQYKDRRFSMRTHYEKTIETLETVFERKSIFYGFYEELFQAPRLAEVSDFLGIETRPELVSEQVNPGHQYKALTEDEKRVVVQHYREVYAFCALRWPHLRDIWPGYEYLDV